VRPQQRPQSMAELRAALNGQLQPPLRTVAPPLVQPQGEDPDRTVVIPRGSRPTEPPPLRPASPTVDLRLETPPPPPSAAAAPPAAGGKPAPALIAGGLAALVLIAAAAWWALRPAAPAALPATDTPGMAALPASAAASATTSAPASATAALPAPAPASTLVPPAAATAALSPPAASSAPAKAASKPAARASAPVRGEANRRPGRDPAGVPSLPQGDASLQQPPPAATAQPARAAAPERSAAPAAEEPAGPLDPRQACAKENVLMRVWCVDRRCEKPAYAGHAECVRLREIREQRRER